MTIPKILKGIFILIPVSYLSIYVAIFFLQRDFMYFPYPSIDIPKDKTLQIKTTFIQGADNHKLWTWYKQADKNKPTFVYFHGNTKAQDWRTPRIKSIIEKGYGIVMPTYRYNSMAGGKPSEKNLISDARNVVLWTQKTFNLSQKNIIIYGESLGSGVATQIAQGDSFKALILEVPYDRISSGAKHAFPYFYIPDFLIKDTFTSIDYITNVKIPVLIGGATQDDVLPVISAQRLFEKANEPKNYVEIDKVRHNAMFSTPEWIGYIQRFIINLEK